MKSRFFLFCTLVLAVSAAWGPPEPSYRIGLLKYSGGGDWYANIETSLPNLASFCNRELGTNFDPEQEVIEAGSAELFNVPLVHMTGHGNVVFSDQEAQNIRKYLSGGGFLHISDNYGMDPFIRPQMKKVFPELEFVELPFDHPIYHQHFEFASGLPKIHEHDGKDPKGFGLIWNGRLVCFYDVECDLGDGWEDPEVHRNAEGTRLKALRMGANIVQYALNH